MIKNNVLVSLIIPVYNVEKYLSKCLSSAINQTLKEIEIILVNDGSTDNSLQICREYERKDSRIKLINQKNNGLGISRNNALKIARGEFISFLDSDDWLALETLEESYSQAIKNSSDIVIYGFERIDENTDKCVQTRDDINFDIKKISKEDFFKKIIAANFKHMSCAMLVKKNLFVKYCIKFPSTLHEDLYVTPQLFYFSNKISFLKKNYYKWLIRKDSITNTITSKHIDGIITAIFYIKSFLLKENIYIKYKNEYINFCLVYLSMIYKRIQSYIEDPKKKQLLLEELIFKSYSILDIKCIVNLTNSKFKDFILLYLEVSTSLKFNQSIDYNIRLGSELTQIKNSNGYQFLLKYYKYRDKVLPIGSKRQKVLKKIINFILNFKIKDYIPNNFTNSYDVVFLPHKDYHVWTMGLIARELKKINISSCFLDITDYYRDEGLRKEASNFLDIPLFDFKLLKKNSINYNCLICMNDWDMKNVRPEVEKAKKMGKITIGIVEGVQDFLDLDTNQSRQPYRTVEYIFLTGEHDQQFFVDKIDKTSIIGVPRLQKLLNLKPRFPKKPLAVINMNFSYNVLTDKAEEWLQSAVMGCKIAKVNYIITQHPADKTDLSSYNVTSKSMYEIIETASVIISRFGSTIIESLSMGKPCIYHNPHNEKVIKYQYPIGAYSLSNNQHNLSEKIIYELNNKNEVRKRANEFLNLHCNINSDKTSAILASQKIKELLTKY